MSITPITLTGISSYASDFQSILNRAVQIAQIPLTILQNQDSTVLQQKSDLGTLSGTVASLAASLQSLGSVASSRAVGASSSNSSVITAAATGATSTASYTIDSVTSLASAAAERSLNNYADSAATPVSATGTVKLTVGSQNYVLSLANNSLVGLRDQINGLSAGVTASILTTPTGNYLSLTANTTGETTLALTDDPTTDTHTGADTSLLTNTNQGSNAEFSLDGIDIIQSSNTVNSVIPGVTFQLQAKSAAPVTISLATNPSGISTALQSFVDTLNAANAQVKSQVGTGSLAGNSVLTGLQNVLGQLTSYHLNSGTTRSLADLGITFDATGKAAFDASTFASLSDTQIADGLTFLGSPATGLAGFSKTLSQYSDPLNGFITTAEAGLTQTDTHLQAQMVTLADQINNMQNSLSKQLALADSLVAQLDSQKSALTASLQGLSLVLYGQNPSSV